MSGRGGYGTIEPQSPNIDLNTLTDVPGVGISLRRTTIQTLKDLANSLTTVEWAQKLIAVSTGVFLFTWSLKFIAIMHWTALEFAIALDMLLFSMMMLLFELAVPTSILTFVQFHCFFLSTRRGRAMITLIYAFMMLLMPGGLIVSLLTGFLSTTMIWISTIQVNNLANRLSNVHISQKDLRACFSRHDREKIGYAQAHEMCRLFALMGIEDLTEAEQNTIWEYLPVVEDGIYLHMVAKWVHPRSARASGSSRSGRGWLYDAKGWFGGSFASNGGLDPNPYASTMTTASLPLQPNGKSHNKKTTDV